MPEPRVLVKLICGFSKPCYLCYCGFSKPVCGFSKPCYLCYCGFSKPVCGFSKPCYLDLLWLFQAMLPLSTLAFVSRLFQAMLPVHWLSKPP